MKIREFFSRWFEGIKNLSAAQQVHAKIVASYGNIIGICFAWVFLWFKGFWFFSISMFFVVILLGIDLIGLHQQYKQACNIADELKQLESLYNCEDDKNVLEKQKIECD